MSISMELRACRSFSSLRRAHSCSSASKFVLYGHFRRPVRFCRKRLKLSSERFRGVAMSSGFDGRGEDCGEFGGDLELVEVIGIGSRIDAVLDFCLDSPFESSSMRFWNIVSKDSLKVQLQQRLLSKDFAPKIVEAPLDLKYRSKAIILVASAGYGSDHIAAIDILRTLRSTDGFSVAIVLKPFSFEGQRRQDEVKDLIEKLREHTNFCIDIDTDLLLKKDTVTLDEALKTANNAVLLAINLISVLISETHRKLIYMPQNNVKELKVSETTKILESFKVAKIGFGAGYNMKTSITQAIYDCPFLGSDVKDLNGMVICVLASSSIINNSDINSFLHIFRQVTDHKREIIISVIYEPNLEPNLLVTTVVIVGCINKQASQKSSILSKLAQGLPYVLNLLRKQYIEPKKSEGENYSFQNDSQTEVIESPLSPEKGNKIAMDDIARDFGKGFEESQTTLSTNHDEINGSRSQNPRSDQIEVGISEEGSNFYELYDQVTEGSPALQREPLVSWNLGSGYQIAQEWAKERAAESGGSSMPDNISIFTLPVGIKPSEEVRDSGNVFTTVQNTETKAEDDVGKPLASSSTTSWGAFTDVGFEAVKDLYNSASILLKGKYVADDSKKDGVLSVRAASMLEAERDSPKKWSPIMEMQYRGGIYKGRCQGGLPEGKGRLVLGDGSIYDGMWRYGKRSGQGTFYFSNGDVFQGSWRDDIMHGKGWFYFHSGDRWFANFWKGKANGEGRFYSQSGHVFFGPFRDGWRHGHFLCIDVNGARYSEVWDDGVLVERKQLESG